MPTRVLPLTVATFLAAAAAAQAWTSPGSGACYTPDDLVAVTGGAVTGAWPDYVQQQALLISPGDTLLWPAGTQWTVAGGQELRVRGRMLAPGTPWSPILARSLSGQPNGWSGLILDGAGTAGSLLRCVTLRGGDDGLNCLSSAPLVEYCTLSGNHSSGLSCFQAGDPVLRHCLVEGNSRYGVEVTGGSNPVLQHCVVRGNNTEAASPRNAVSVGVQGSNSPRLVSCRLEGLGPANPASGFSLWMSGGPVLRDCEIRHFRSGAVIQGSGAGGLLERCWIHDNRYANPMQGGSGANVNTSAMPVFRGCCLEDNDWGVTITSACTPDFGTMAAGGGNRLHGNGNGGNVWDFYNNTTSVIQARGNWWGTTDPAAIDLHIHDNGDGAFGDVPTDPILGDSLFAPHLSPDLGFAALAAGATLSLRPADHFRPVPGLAFTLEGPGSVEWLGDSLRWTPPAGPDSLLTLLLRAQTPQGQSTCDTIRVWRQAGALPGPLLTIARAGYHAVLSWSPVAGAGAYRVERCPLPTFPAEQTTTVWEGTETAWQDENALVLPRAFYRVVALLPERGRNR